MYLAWTIVGLVVISIELFLWTVFKSKARGISFPREADESFFRFFTLLRLRLVMFFHTLGLLLVFILSSLFLW